jgi:hypothetical protein
MGYCLVRSKFFLILFCNYVENWDLFPSWDNLTTWWVSGCGVLMLFSSAHSSVTNLSKNRFQTTLREHDPGTVLTICKVNWYLSKTAFHFLLHFLSSCLRFLSISLFPSTLPFSTYFLLLLLLISFFVTLSFVLIFFHNFLSPYF